jgi:hypothetical protein
MIWLRHSPTISISWSRLDLLTVSNETQPGIVIVQLPLYRSNQALDIFKRTLDIWKGMKYAGVDECEGAPESGGWTKAA